jgi:hypothetical protein
MLFAFFFTLTAIVSGTNSSNVVIANAADDDYFPTAEGTKWVWLMWRQG